MTCSSSKSILVIAINGKVETAVDVLLSTVTVSVTLLLLLLIKESPMPPLMPQLQPRQHKMPKLNKMQLMPRLKWHVKQLVPQLNKPQLVPKLKQLMPKLRKTQLMPKLKKRQLLPPRLKQILLPMLPPLPQQELPLMPLVCRAHPNQLLPKRRAFPYASAWAYICAICSAVS
jgi:hypothetical protein